VAADAADFGTANVLVDLRVQAEAIERGFFGGVGANRAAQPERQLHAVDGTIVGVVKPVLDGGGLRLLATARAPTRAGNLMDVRRHCDASALAW
jgi:hypothetical protein